MNDLLDFLESAPASWRAHEGEDLYDLPIVASHLPRARVYET